LAGLQAELSRASDLIVLLLGSVLERSARFCARMHQGSGEMAVTGTIF
jgi:hypothetical protein